MTYHEDAIAKLAAVLPPAEDATQAEDIDRQARAVLSILLDRVSAVDAAKLETVPEDPLSCPNCSQPATSERSPYCGPLCREQSAFIRQFRANLRAESVIDEERQASMGQVLWNLIGGGYPRRNAMVQERALKRVFDRTEGKCDACGAPATTFDHIGSACNRPINLRPMCDDCAKTKPFGSPAVLERPRSVELLVDVAERVRSDAPLRVCDDQETWDWRAYVKTRQSLLAADAQTA